MRKERGGKEGKWRVKTFVPDDWHASEELCIRFIYLDRGVVEFYLSVKSEQSPRL